MEWREKGGRLKERPLAKIAKIAKEKTWINKIYRI